MVHPGSSPGSHVESCHRRGRRSVWKQRRINRIYREFRYVHQCNLIRMLQRTHRIRWMYFEVVSQSVSPMNWFTKSWMSSRSFLPVRAVIQHAMETSSYPQEFAVLGLIMLMGLNELYIIWLAKACSIAYISIRHLSRSLLPGIAQGYVSHARGFHFKPHSLSGIS